LYCIAVSDKVLQQMGTAFTKASHRPVWWSCYK